MKAWTGIMDELFNQPHILFLVYQKLWCISWDMKDSYELTKKNKVRGNCRLEMSECAVILGWRSRDTVLGGNGEVRRAGIENVRESMERRQRRSEPLHDGKDSTERPGEWFYVWRILAVMQRIECWKGRAGMKRQTFGTVSQEYRWDLTARRFTGN